MKVYVWKGETITVTQFRLGKKGNAPILGKRQLTTDEWSLLAADIQPHLFNKTRFDLYEHENKKLEYIPIVPLENDQNDLLDDDLQRSFEQGVNNTQELTKSKWDKIVKVGVVFLVILFSVGSFLLFMVMLNKGQTDFAAKFAGIAQQGLNVTKVFGA